MNYITLNDGSKIPQIGMGAYLLPDDDTTVESLVAGLKMGYRLIDTAAAYTNERSVGKAIRESGIPREEIYLTTKLWVQDYGYENASKAVDKCLERLGLDYIDLLLIHRPAGDNIGAYKALEDAQKAGKVKSIGICNHTVGQLTELLANTSVIPAVNQVECHPLQQEKALRSLLDEKNIVLESWFPLGHGSKRLNLNADLLQMAERYGKSVQQLILRWHIQEGFVVIPKSSNPEHMKDNLNIFDFEISEEDMTFIRSLDMNRYLGGDPEAKENFEKWESIRYDI